MNIIKLSAIASTNSYLKDLARSTNLEDETVVVTVEQTSGRGQRGAVWQSKKGKSLTFSVFKRFSNLSSVRHFDLSLAVSLALAKVLIKFEVPQVSVKWPNDIMSAQNKCAGILIENRLEANHIAHCIVGIGLNVNESSFEGLPKATSLFQQTGRNFNLDELLVALSSEIIKELKLLEETLPSKLQEEYERLLFRKDLISVFEDVNKERKNGIIRGVTASGLLRVEHDDAVFKTYDLKQVRLCY